MSTLYILYSKRLNRYYVGITSTLLSERLEKHNHSSYGFHYTSKASDWVVTLAIECDSFALARRMEIHIKRMKSRKFIELLIHDEKEVQKLKNLVSSRLSR